MMGHGAVVSYEVLRMSHARSCAYINDDVY